jgi:iron-sulfur cluster repair protein YtfE (RIC family)
MRTCREQHDALRFLLEKLPAAAPVEPADAAKLLARLSAVLLAHLKLEDDQLYPALARSSDRTVRETALHYREEMGGLKQSFDAFMSAWGSAEQISADQDDFIAAWSAVRSVLEIRMAKEDHGLYSIAEDYFSGQESA